jgi:hypothetical protein
MSDDTFRPISDQPLSSDRPTPPPSTDPYLSHEDHSGEVGKTFLAGVVGGILSAAGYLVYTRLPDEQKERLHAQARQLIESRVNELRSRFNI